MYKKQGGLTGVDVTIAIVTITFFTGLILSLMYNVKNQNYIKACKITSDLYLTETLENIGIIDFDEVVTTSSNSVSQIIPQLPAIFSETVSVENISDIDPNKENIIKKVTVTISYNIGNRNYEKSVQRLKIKDI